MSNMKLRAINTIQYSAEGMALPGTVFEINEKSGSQLVLDGHAEEVADEKPAKKADAKKADAKKADDKKADDKKADDEKADDKKAADGEKPEADDL